MNTIGKTTIAAGIGHILSMLTGACSHQAASDTTTPVRSAAQVQLGIPCAPLVSARDGANPPASRLFLEVADLTHVSAEARRSALQHEVIPLDHIAIANGMFADNQRSSVPFNCSQVSQCGQRDDQAPPSCELSLTPTLPTNPGDPIRLSGIALHTAAEPPQGAGTDVQVHDQQSTLVELRSDAGCTISVAITPYVVTSEKDLLLYTQCKHDAHTANAKLTQP